MLHPKLNAVLVKTQDLIGLAEVIARSVCELHTLQIKAIDCLTTDSRMIKAAVSLLVDCGLVSLDTENQSITWIDAERN